MPFRRCDWWIAGAYSTTAERFVFLRMDETGVTAESHPERASRFASESAAQAELQVHENELLSGLSLEAPMLLSVPGIAYEL